MVEEQPEEIKELSNEVHVAGVTPEGGKPKEKRIWTCLTKKVKVDQEEVSKIKTVEEDGKLCFSFTFQSTI